MEVCNQPASRARSPGGSGGHSVHVSWQCWLFSAVAVSFQSASTSTGPLLLLLRTPIRKLGPTLNSRWSFLKIRSLLMSTKTLIQRQWPPQILNWFKTYLSRVHHPSQYNYYIQDTVFEFLSSEYINSFNSYTKSLTHVATWGLFYKPRIWGVERLTLPASHSCKSCCCIKLRQANSSVYTFSPVLLKILDIFEPMLLHLSYRHSYLNRIAVGMSVKMPGGGSCYVLNYWCYKGVKSLRSRSAGQILEDPRSISFSGVTQRGAQEGWLYWNGQTWDHQGSCLREGRIFSTLASPGTQ